MNKEKIAEALALIGSQKKLRESFVEWCKQVEQELPYTGSIRDDLTRHLVDAVYANVPMETKSLANGLTFDFIPNIGSKVAREFIMSTPKVPDFVWEPQTTRLLLYLSNFGKNVVIGGAYFVDQTLLVAENIKAKNGSVFAFDLNAKQISILEKNCKTNNISNVKVTPLGLWSNSKTLLNLSDDDDLAFASLVEDSESANTITVDDFMEKNKINELGLIMLDIEGSEFEVLKGAEKQLKKPAGESPNIIFEIHRSYVNWDKGLASTDIVKYLQSFGYKIFSLRDFQG